MLRQDEDRDVITGERQIVRTRDHSGRIPVLGADLAVDALIDLVVESQADLAVELLRSPCEAEPRRPAHMANRPLAAKAMSRACG
jgi:hypothetical protein